MRIAAFRRFHSAMLRPAGNLHLCGALSLAAAVAVLVEVSFFPSKGMFVLVAAPTIVAALALIHAASRSPGRSLDDAIAGAANAVGLNMGLGGSPSSFSVVLYCAGIIGSVAGYAWLALTSSAVTRQDVIAHWGLLDKRQLVFAYLVVVAFVLFHCAMMHLVFDPPHAAAPAARDVVRRPWLARLLGALVIAVLAYCSIATAALRDVVADGAALARFYEYHSLVHLGALEQIRLGAMPYLEAQTQYGLGNQLLLYCLTDFLGFSNHGFHAGVILIDVLCIVGFFLVVQQVLGFGWAIAALVGWALWPSPAGVLPVAGWAILTRWLAVPVLALLLARLLLAAGPTPRAWIGAVLAGAVWGAGGFMSQENLSGGLLVLALSLALYGPVCGRSAAGLARFAGLFVIAGVAVFAMLTGGAVGPSRILDVLRQAGAQSALVMAGVSNSVWSENVGLTLVFDVVHGWIDRSLETQGDLRPLLQTYGFALLLMVVLGLLAGMLGRSWPSIGGRQRQFVWKFAGVTVGAYALHLFTLLRSDLSHLAGPSFLLPLFLLALPLFAWRCLRPGFGRGALLLVSAALIVDAAIAGSAEISRRVAALGSTLRDTAQALEVYRALHGARGQPLDLASRYSPLPKVQAAFRSQPSFDELQELIGLLRERLQGRPVELVLPTPDDPMADPELLYFFGGFRSVSGITSPRGTIWLKSDEDAWIRRILASRTACVFFDPGSLDSRLFREWQEQAKDGAAIVTQPIAGRRLYGLLSCRS